MSLMRARSLYAVTFLVLLAEALLPFLLRPHPARRLVYLGRAVRDLVAGGGGIERQIAREGFIPPDGT